MIWDEFYTVDDRFTFGRHKGRKLSEVLDIDPDYVVWCVENIDTFLIEGYAMRQIREGFRDFLIQPEFEACRRRNLDFNIEQTCGDCWDDYEPEPRTFERYGGSYAQDIAGYSDDDIDTIFDGDPDAYWNID